MKEFDDADMDVWWSYFAGIAPTGLLVADQAFAPLFEGGTLMTTDRVVSDAAVAYPELAQVSIGLAGTHDAPAVTFESIHPYANGFVVECRGRRTAVAREAAQWPLDLTPGTHVAEVKVCTGYGEVPAGRISYRAR